ncbi:MAG: hypothetical protein LC130_15880 [Bryobacterales bacterium]|nr:hypothetical protein [Bryobacterales bacterium]
MATLSEQDRFDVWAQWMRENAEAIPITKSALRAALDALDDFMQANETAMNSAIPQPARNQLSVSQKAALLSAVIARRYMRAV